MTIRTWGRLTAAAALLVLASCGGGDEEALAPTVAPPETPTPLAVQTGSGAAPDGSEVASGQDAGAASAPPPEAASQALSAVEVVERVRPAVVTVVNEQRLGGFGAEQAQEAGRGTGFIIDEAGHVVTNEHVVRGGDRFEVIFADGEKRPATLVGADPLSDLAVVRVEEGIPATVPFGDSEALRPGQPVLAIGSPLGEFTNTVTDGIVGGLGRDLPGAANQDIPGYSNLIQHNAAINPGNSGGPLFDMVGRVVGVNTLGIPEVPGQGIPAQGLFFAIPANTVRDIAAQLIDQGRVAYPYLGVGTEAITPELASQYELPVDHGAFALRVEPNSPAAQGGIREGDFILSIGGSRINQDTSLLEALFRHRPGETVEVVVWRDGGEVPLEVTLAERPPR